MMIGGYLSQSAFAMTSRDQWNTSSSSMGGVDLWRHLRENTEQGETREETGTTI